MKPDMNQLCREPFQWLEGNSFDSDVAISTRIRLARNIDSVQFPGNADDSILSAVRDTVLDTLRTCIENYNEKWLEFKMNELSEYECGLLLERRSISPEFFNSGTCRSLITKKNDGSGIMINEEDHLRIQSFGPGYQLKSIWDTINELDNVISRHIPYSYDKKLGFLTSCPSNLGTGMRASVMLHIPGLVMTGQSKAFMNAINKLHLAVRGINGEGSDTVADLFQISNQSTLGESEEEILERLGGVVSQIIISERAARAKLLEKQQELLLNRVGRAYGLLKHSYLISAREATEHLFFLRLGVHLGFFDALTIDDVNDLLRLVQPAHLQCENSRIGLSPMERGVLRATVLREKLKNK